MSAEKQDAWFSDQYCHPHESKHTMDEVLRWYQEAGIEFINAIPKFRPDEAFSAREHLLGRSEPGTGFQRAMAQAQMIVKGSREGGFFVVIGRKHHIEDKR